MVFIKAKEGKLGHRLSKQPDQTTADLCELMNLGPEDNRHMCTHVDVDVWCSVQCCDTFSNVCPNTGLGQHTGLVTWEGAVKVYPELIKKEKNKKKENIKPNEKIRLKPLGNH